MRLRALTPAEENIMQILWKLKRAFVKDIIREMATPKPAYNTVSTVLRVLEKKKFVRHKSDGNSHEYYPVLTSTEYKSFALSKVFNNYFNSSYKDLMSFLVDKNDIDAKELNELVELIKNLKDK